MTGRHVAKKGRKTESETKPFRPVLILEYNDFVGKWNYTVIMPYVIVSSTHGRYQTWREAKLAAQEAWAEYEPSRPAPDFKVCYTHDQYYDAITKAGWR